ncbi:hypothetical protein BP5796_08468 [Coleophoma crateriformis]|uniref:Homeobox domain-containing protein n=1 Tax=Coleophoma crateriformis TaxID=565419 RepID=A0A3D8R814_9HELO|nr:hypothetical protein BP5796_08468 [Coleophoma crateriformis]
MIVAHQYQSGRNTWTSRNLGAVYHNASSPRMSNFDSLSAQQDWREQFSSGTASEGTSSSYGRSSTLNAPGSTQAQSEGIKRSQLEQQHNFEPSTLRQENQTGQGAERAVSAQGESENPTAAASGTNSVPSPVSTVLSLSSEKPSTISSAALMGEGGPVGQEDSNAQIDFKEEDLDDDDEDDEMLDAEDGSNPQTAAERRAERRKMKRFRLTHQQTRFLMSEFAKQAHPDAAHRERLSREIPGLSPRQVQVWFQNRRAKIKRLTVDDRERMMKMRAVPDDFDNVQALHSPYGAVHGIGTPMQSPVVDYVPGYAEHMIRPLMVDTMRRHDGEDHMSPSAMSPAYGHMGYAPPGSVGTPSMLSPLSLNSNERYYSSHVSSPMSAGQTSANMFNRQNNADNYQALSDSRHPVRPLQPIQVRSTMSRSRSESLQSPLRSSMSWKGETLDYGFSQNAQPSPQLSGRQQSTYHGGEQIGNNAVRGPQYDGNAYSNPSMQASPSHMSYAHSQNPSSAPRTSPSSLSRLRSTSAAFPPGLDLRNQYRTLPSQQHHGMPPTPRSGSSFAGHYTSGFQSAPLSAPVDFSLPRTPGEPGRDFSMPQMSAPMAPPQDFANAYNSPVRSHHPDREYAGPEHGQSVSPRSAEQNSGGGPNYETDQKRRRSFTMSGPYENA